MRDPKHVAWTESLRACPVFSEMRSSDLDALVQIATGKHLEKGGFLFHEGDPVTGFYLVRTGAISVQRMNSEGREMVIHVFRRGETFAEGALTLKGYPADAIAVEESELLHISRNGYMKLLQNRSEFALRAVVSLCQHMHQLVGHIDTQQNRSAVSRLADWLLQRCNGHPKTKPVQFKIGVKKSSLANELHMRGETLSRAFAKLTKAGLIQVDGSSITVHAPAQLADEHATQQTCRNPSKAPE